MEKIQLESMSQSYCHKTDSRLGKPMGLQPVAPLSVAPPGMVGSILPGTLQPPLLPDIFIEEPESTDGARNPRYKTEICRNFKERSKCIFGDQCQFAHGRRELRDVVRNSKYKTKLCQKYWVSGYCAYGPRCNFLHDEDVEMTAFALVEYGLVKVADDADNVSEEFVSKRRSPVNVMDVEALEFLDRASCSPSVSPMSGFVTLGRHEPS